MNNYDSNSEHESIEFNVSYDNDLSSVYYHEFAEENTRISFSRDSSLFLIGDVAKPFYTKTQLNKMTKAQLIELDDKYELLQPYDTNECLKQEYIDELKNVTIKQHYEYLASEYSWHNISEQFAHDYYISQGYSQGDSIYVVSVDKPFTKETKAYIDHVFWDSPVYIRIEIDGLDEIREWDLMDDNYEYDKADVVKKLNEMADISDYAKQWLADNLPDTPSYDY